MPTIKDVARRAGVGVGTASRAISGRGAVAPQTLQRVQQAVRELAFRPSNIARALSLRSLGMVGVYVPQFHGWFYGPILGAIDGQLRAAGRHMVTANGCGSGDARQQALDGIDFLIDRQCDGLIVVSHQLSDTDLARLRRRCERLVLLNRQVAGRPSHGFCPDHHLAGRQAARALLARGHREIALVSGPHSAPDNEARVAGFKAELARHRLRVRRAHELEGDFEFSSGHAAAQRLLQPARRGWTALFCANDMMAVGAIAAFSEAGLQLPRDASVLGFDDSPIAAYATPGLTSVRIPIEDMAASGTRFLLNLCYGLALPVQRSFPTAVVWRQSVGDGPHPPLSLPEASP